MRMIRRIRTDDKGVATIEMAFALPVLIIMIWAIVQLGMMFRALAGIQQALGEGARYATICLNPTAAGCTSPTAAQIKTRTEEKVYGIQPGVFNVPVPTSGVEGTTKFFDLSVEYSQPTSLLILPGPTISLTRSKRVWIAAT